MTRIFETNNTIQMEFDSEGRPVRFHWHRRLHRFLKVVQTWSVDTDWWTAEGRVHRDYFAVITMEDLFCVLYHDHLTES